MINRMQAAQQLRKAVQLFAAGLSDEQAMEVAAVFDGWETGKAYAVGDFLSCGVNGVGDPQLYKVVQAHISQADWPPAETAALYAPIGMDARGYPVWSQPAGAHDAYEKGDIVSFEGTLYRSVTDANVYSPGLYPDGWEVYSE